jgi:hypothetical protein
VQDLIDFRPAGLLFMEKRVRAFRRNVGATMNATKQPSAWVLVFPMTHSRRTALKEAGKIRH